MNTNINTKRQLIMIRLDLDNLPSVIPPDGFICLPHKEGEGFCWEEIIKASFGSEYNFEKEIHSDKCYYPERVKYIRTLEGKPVATAIAWVKDFLPKDFGYLHMVGALNEYLGKGLGYWVVLDALHEMKKEGRSCAYLSTDDFRIPAIKTYIKLGFRPLLIASDQFKRWSDIYEICGEKYSF